MKTNLVSALFLTILLPFSLQAQEPAAPEAAPLTPKIVCDEPNFDFGEKPNTGFIEHSYPIRNAGTLSLEIQNVHASCGCTAVKPSQNVIPPGGEAAIEARLDLRGRSGFQQKSITVQCNDPATPTLILQLKGTAVQVLRAQPSSLFFGRIGPGAEHSRTFDIISERGPFQISGTRTDNPGLLVAPVALDPPGDGSTQRFNLTIDPAFPEGNLNGTVFIKTDMDDQSELAIPVSAYIANAAETPPASEPAPAP